MLCSIQSASFHLSCFVKSNQKHALANPINLSQIGIHYKTVPITIDWMLLCKDQVYESNCNISKGI